MSSVVPDGWSVYALGELGQVVGGGTPPSETPSYWGGSVMWATPAEITKLKSRYINKTLRTITKEGLQKSSAKLHPKGSILLTSRASIGYPAINSVPMATNQGFQSLRPNEKLDVEYGYQLILNNRNGLERLSAGSTFLEISSKEINKYKLPIPPLPEQKKIASILTSVDEVIENTQKQIDKLQDLKKATMNELFTKGIGHTEFKDSELGRIPKGWEVVKLGDISNVTKLAGFEYTEHFDYSTGGEIIALRALNLDGRKLDLTNIQTIPKSVSDALPRSKLFYGDILISYVGSVGNLGFIYDDDRFHLAPNVAKISCDLKRVNAQFILKQLLSDRAQKNIEDLTTITSQPSLNMANIRKIRLLVCPINEQEKIDKILSSLYMKSDFLEQKLTQTQSLKKSLMQDLLTGKVRVTVN